ncbi:hypothetical protein [Thiolinea disciformis]|nr:hypothetical protein [Thiolinea disciformis]
MLTITATQIKNAFGRFLEAVQSQPILIERSKGFSRYALIR